MTNQNRVLVVEDELALREALIEHLGKSYEVLIATSGEEAKSVFTENRVDVVILDLHLPDCNGLSLIEMFRKTEEAEVVVVTAYPKIQSAVKALKAGAYDFISKPFDLDELDVVVGRALERGGLRREVTQLRHQEPSKASLSQLLGPSSVMNQLRDQIQQVAQSPNTTVLLRGESGTGKELVAEAIHSESERSNGPFICMGCSSIPADMIETELFGREADVSSEVSRGRHGLVHLAHGGTLFLDEIGDLPSAFQPKLLRALEGRALRPLGGQQAIRSDVRFIAASVRDLEAMAAAGEFRKELLFRVKVFEIMLPPLRERRDDVPVLARHFLREFRDRLGKPVEGFSARALTALCSYAWPGNVRELRNVVERAVIVAQKDTIDLSDLPPSEQTSSADAPTEANDLGAAPVLLAEVEKRHIVRVYRLAAQNKSRTAEILGISRSTLREKLKQYGMS